MPSIGSLRAHYVVALSLALACRVATAPVDAAPRFAISPGGTIERSFGAAKLLIHVSEQLAQVDVEVRLGQRVVGGRKLNPADDTLPLHFESGGAAIEGSIAARFAYAAQASSLQGDFTVRDGSGEPPFRGELAAWAWAVPVVSRYSTVWLTPELNAEIKLLLSQDQSVAIRFMTAGQSILNVTLSQGANDVRVKQGFRVGTVRIRPGMALRLQPATPVQTGEVVLRGVFSSSNHPRVRYQGAVVSWQYAQVTVSGSPE